MASSADFVQFVCEQAAGPWTILPRRMFGDWLIYADGRPVMILGDNVVYVKMIPELAQLMDGSPTGCPYPTARAHYVLDVEDRELVYRAVEILAAVTPLPVKKSRAKKEKKT